MFGQRPSRPVNDSGKNVHVQDIGQIEGTLVKAADAAVQGARALRVDGNAVSFPDQLLQPGRDGLQALAGGEEIGFTDDEAV